MRYEGRKEHGILFLRKSVAEFTLLGIFPETCRERFVTLLRSSSRKDHISPDDVRQVLMEVQ